MSYSLLQNWEFQKKPNKRKKNETLKHTYCIKANGVYNPCNLYKVTRTASVEYGASDSPRNHVTGNNIQSDKKMKQTLEAQESSQKKGLYF